jgi:hypothetical protein
MPGNLTVTLTPFQYAVGQTWNTARFNLGFNPTMVVNGNLNQLANVSATAPADTQALVWDAANSLWKPGTVGRAYLQVMIGASAGVNGAAGAVPQPLAGEQGKFLRGDGSWQDPSNPAAVTNNMFLQLACF